MDQWETEGGAVSQSKDASIASLERQLETALRDRDEWRRKARQLDVLRAAALQQTSGLLATLQPLADDPAFGFQ